MSNELATRESQLATRQEPTTGELMQAVIASGITESSVAVMERLTELKWKEEERAAEREFARAFVSLQNSMGAVSATKVVPGNDDSIRYRFAPYEEIMRTVRPLIVANGFAITFDSKPSADGKQVAVTCTLMHSGGHSRSNTYTGRIGKGPPGSSESQADGAGYTYAKRFALCAALNITVEQDTDGAQDARNVGGPVSSERAAEIERRARACGIDVAKFLKWCQVFSFEEIPSSMDKEIEAQLLKKEAVK